MILADVVGSVVATEKNEHYEGLKVLIVQPVNPDGSPDGATFLAVDGVKAGVGDRVLVVDEGGSSRAVIGRPGAVTVRTAVAAVVDEVDGGVS